MSVLYQPLRQGLQVRRSTVHSVRSAAMLAVVVSQIVAVPSRALQAQPSSVPRVVTTEWLATEGVNRSVVLIEVVHAADASPGIPGARTLAYDQLVMRRGTLSTELPSADSLRALFASLGVSDDSHVVVYAHEGPAATRALFSLTSIGHDRYSLLDGGLVKWRAEGRPVTTVQPRVAAGRLTPRPHRALVVDAQYVQSRIGRPGIALIDTRTDGEYNGTGNRSGMPSAGHIGGARQIEWETLFVDGTVTLKPRAELERLFAERVQSGATVVTYCWIGYRASATWFVAHWLGYDVALYDGSYQDWMQRQLPTTAGSSP